MEPLLALLYKKNVGSGAQHQTRGPAQQSRRDPPVANRRPDANNHQRAEYYSSHRPLQVALFDQQLQSDSKAVTSEEPVEGGNRAERGLSDNAQLIVPG